MNEVDKMEKVSGLSSHITYRAGTAEDSYSTFLIFEETLADLLPRLGIDDPEAMARIWEERRGLYDHLVRSAEHFWIAERDGVPVGFARSTLHDGVLELSEFFVQPKVQSGGVGRTLFERVFPKGAYRFRVIIATPDLRAQARYLKSGVYPRFPLMYFGKSPGPISVETDLTFQAISAAPTLLDELDALDEAVIGFKRRVDHE